ncbi:MAG: rod shape-determining protein MreB [Burkholderiaceae bacterium]
MLGSLTPLLYLQVSPVIVVIRNLKTGAAISAAPELALSADNPPKVLGVGNSARSAAKAATQARLINPFAHPRTMVSDFTSAEILLKALVGKVLKKSLLSPAPSMVIHPMGNPDGGFHTGGEAGFQGAGDGGRCAPGLGVDGAAVDGRRAQNPSDPADAGHWEA